MRLPCARDCRGGEAVREANENPGKLNEHDNESARRPEGERQGKRIIVVGEHKAGIFRFVSKVSACCRLSDSSF